jgi:hypothetical protein
MVVDNGHLVVKPMRYQCRPAGKPAFYDTKYPGTYNALGTLLTVSTHRIYKINNLRTVTSRPCRSA